MHRGRAGQHREKHTEIIFPSASVSKPSRSSISARNVPVPAAAVLCGNGLVGIASWLRRHKRLSKTVLGLSLICP